MEPPVGGHTAQTTNLGLKFCHAFGAPPRRCLEDRLKIRVLNAFRTRAETLFSVSAYFDQIVQRRDYVLVVHGKFLF
jgi:hypothetical protein